MIDKDRFFHRKCYRDILSIDVVSACAILIIVSIFFLIPIEISGIGIRLDDILILLFVPLLVLIKARIKRRKYILFLMLFLLSTIISTIYGYVFLDVPFNYGDINEIIRYFKILLFFIVLSYIDVEVLSVITFKIFHYGTLYIIFVGYFQYFDLFSIGKYLSLMYTSDTQIYAAIEHSVRRITITGSGPNDGAIVVAYFLLFNFFYFIFTNKRKYLVLFFLLFTVLFFTQSRTVLLAVVFSIISVLFILRGKLIKKIFLLSVVVVFIMLSFPLFSYVSVGFETLLEGTNNSVLVRLENAKLAYQMFLNSPLLGYGIAKSLVVDVRMDSEYLSIISRFGLIGLTFALVLIFYPVALNNRVAKIGNYRLNIIYFTLVSSSLVGAVVMITNNFISGYQSFLPFILLIALTLNFLDYYDDEKRYR